MNKNIVIEKLEKIFYECDRHLLRVKSSSNELEPMMPLDKEKYLELHEESIKVLDQYLFRFAQLQDAMGQKLFKTMLIFLEENVENTPFIDLLNRMEKLELLESSRAWKELRDDRNELTHNYEDEPEEMSEAINRLYAKREILENIYLRIKDYYASYLRKN